MKKYQVIWGWNPPQQDDFQGNLRIFYNTEQKTGIRKFQNLESVETIEEYTYWLCDVIEFTKEEVSKINILEECIKAYDTSHCVNEFTINNIPMWLDKDTRTGLMLRFEAESKSGKTETTLWYKDQKFTLPLDKAIQMLKDIEVYASKCYDVTQQHLYNISTLENIDNYDYKSGYPEKLKL